MTAQDSEFSVIYGEYFGFVQRTLRRLGVRDADAADRAQAVFLVTYAKLGVFEGRATLKSWLAGICRGVARNYRRGLLRRGEVALDGEVLAGYVSHGDAAEARDGIAQAEAILRKLPRSKSQVFMLSRVEELAASEIANRLGISEAKVRYRLRSAHELLLREAGRV